MEVQAEKTIEIANKIGGGALVGCLEKLQDLETQPLEALALEVAQCQGVSNVQMLCDIANMIQYSGESKPSVDTLAVFMRNVHRSEGLVKEECALSALRVDPAGDRTASKACFSLVRAAELSEIECEGVEVRDLLAGAKIRHKFQVVTLSPKAGSSTM